VAAVDGGPAVPPASAGKAKATAGRSVLATTAATRPAGMGGALWFAAAGLGGLLLLTTAALRKRFRR
jgi:hypothetical protein